MWPVDIFFYFDNLKSNNSLSPALLFCCTLLLFCVVLVWIIVHDGGDGILMCDNSVDDVIAVLLVRMDHFDLSILNDLDDIGDLLEHQYIVRDDNI